MQAWLSREVRQLYDHVCCEIRRHRGRDRLVRRAAYWEGIGFAPGLPG